MHSVMEKSALEELQNVIERLTGPDGCPWDKEQSPESLADYIICLLYTSRCV